MVGAIDQSFRGIHAGIDRLDTSAARIARNGADRDAAGNLVDAIGASQDVRANVAALRTADELIGTLLDVMA